MPRDDLIRLVEVVMAGDGSEAGHDALVEVLERSVRHPRVLDLIYHSDPPLTAEEVVDAAFSYQPFAL
ncbi:MULTISPECIES: hypothetical protein [Streptomyces]|uniref:E9imm peptide n=1 Tax=Streptomyces ehimensis TaxID=68195 RepID=A0ABV9BKU9_9ACTN